MNHPFDDPAEAYDRYNRDWVLARMEFDEAVKALRAWTETPVFSPESHEGSVSWSVIEQWTENARALTKAILRMKP